MAWCIEVTPTGQPARAQRYKNPFNVRDGDRIAAGRLEHIRLYLRQQPVMLALLAVLG
jgi:hypothetical protein